MRQVLRIRLLILLLITIVALSGCLRLREPEVAAALPLDDALPATWIPLQDVQEVNIDGDSTPEYLLIFAYDAANGPVGAVIYDTQIGGGVGEEGTESSRPASSLVPYPILPSYRVGAGQGFVAGPQRTGAANSTQGRTDAVTVYPLTFGTPATESDTTSGGIARANVLALLGGTTYLTYVWWQAERNDYGVVQLYARSRFESTTFQSFDWASWRNAPRPIEEIIAVHPLNDRSLLCRRTKYTLIEPAPGISGTQAIAYHESDLGLNFCNRLPTVPFYPEAVVLAYLLSGNDNLLDTETIDDAAATQIETTVAYNDIIRINDLAGYMTIAQDTHSTTGNGTAYTTVCVEILLPGNYVGHDTPASTPINVERALVGAQPQMASGQAQFAQRWLLFTLRHVPPQLDPPTSDRLYITNVQVIPVPSREVGLDCKDWLGS